MKTPAAILKGMFTDTWCRKQNISKRKEITVQKLISTRNSRQIHLKGPLFDTVLNVVQI